MKVVLEDAHSLPVFLEAAASTLRPVAWRCCFTSAGVAEATAVPLPSVIVHCGWADGEYA